MSSVRAFLKRVGERVRRFRWWQVAAVVAVLCATGYAIRGVVIDHESHSAVLAHGIIHGQRWNLTLFNDCEDQACGTLCLQFDSLVGDGGCGANCDNCDGLGAADTEDSFSERLLAGLAPKGTVQVWIESSCHERGAQSINNGEPSHAWIVARVGVRRSPEWPLWHGVWWFYRTRSESCEIEPAYYLSASGKQLWFGS